MWRFQRRFGDLPTEEARNPTCASAGAAAPCEGPKSVRGTPRRQRCEKG